MNFSYLFIINVNIYHTYTSEKTMLLASLIKNKRI
jgi:hypothetical protein